MASQTGNPPVNPFDHAFEMLGKAPEVVTEEVNADALEKLTQALTMRAHDRGRMILLRSPRAGFGKTHLLTRLCQRVAHSHEFIPLEPIKGKELDAQSVLDAVLRKFSRVLPAGGGLTVLDLLARRIFAAGLEPLVKSGEVPSQDRDTALQALQMRPVETFDFHNEEAVTAQWAMANFSLLGPRLTAELAERTDSGFRPIAWWVELLFHYSSTPIDQTTRNSSLFETVFSTEQIATDVHEKLVALLNLTGIVTSPVLVLDEVEGFSSNPEAALQVATFLNALHQSCEKLALIISVNGDVWETAFLPRIPCGLKDRLSDIVVDLKPMEKETAVKMLRDRAGDKADAITEELDFDSGVIYARGVIRCAANTWSDVVGDDDCEDGVSTAAYNPISLQQPIEEIVSEEVPPVEPQVEQPEPVSEPTPPTPEPQGESQAESESSLDPAIESVSDQESVTGSFQEEEKPKSPYGELIEPSDGFSARQEDNEVAANVEEETAVPDDQHLPDFSNLPQPTAQPAQPETVPPPRQEPVEAPPQSVVNSPFSIDTHAPVVSPFQVVEPSQPDPHQPQPLNTEPGTAESAAPVASPFQLVPDQPSPNEVTDNDHEKVEDLLRQFRDRYGRD